MHIIIKQCTYFANVEIIYILRNLWILIQVVTNYNLILKFEKVSFSNLLKSRCILAFIVEFLKMVRFILLMILICISDYFSRRIFFKEHIVSVVKCDFDHQFFTSKSKFMSIVDQAKDIAVSLCGRLEISLITH